MTTSPEITIKNIRTIGRLDRLKYTGQLVAASRNVPNIENELPGDKSAYADWLKARRHLQKLRLRSNLSWLLNENVEADLMIHAGRALGIGTLQSSHGYDSEIEPLQHAFANNPRLEVSFWHGQEQNLEQSSPGILVAQHLVATMRKRPDSNAVLWSLTLPGDTSKNEALNQSGFEPVGSPRPRPINDGVLIPRQLWIND